MYYVHGVARLIFIEPNHFQHSSMKFADEAFLKKCHLNFRLIGNNAWGMRPTMLHENLITTVLWQRINLYSKLNQTFSRRNQFICPSPDWTLQSVQLQTVRRRQW